jgi:hypothetical protein
MMKPGDAILVDCGYRGPDYQPCIVLSISKGKDVWGTPRLDVLVRMPNGTEFTTCMPIA